jgi:hypothetical protein
VPPASVRHDGCPDGRAAAGHQGIDRVPGFHAVGNGGDLRRRRQIDDRADDGRWFAALKHFTVERALELDRVEGQAPQVGERCVPRTEIIMREADADTMGRMQLRRCVAGFGQKCRRVAIPALHGALWRMSDRGNRHIRRVGCYAECRFALGRRIWLFTSDAADPPW